MKILIVDDDQASRIVLKDYLKILENIDVIEAEGGKKAIELLRDGLQPDLCFIDLRMPDLDGTSLTGWIRNSTALKNTPVAITSGSRNREEILILAELGIAGYLLKPYKNEQVIELCNSIRSVSGKS